jgi:hypothetical protein
MEASGVLETAIAVGTLDAESQTFDEERIALVDRYLRTPSPDLGDLPPREAVRLERAELWAEELASRPEWLSASLSDLAQAALLPANVELSLAPARALLEAAADGVHLDDGLLPVEVVRRLNDRFRWFDVVGAMPAAESDVPLLVALHEHLVAQRLVAVRSGVLRPTTLGRACLADDTRFWSALVAVKPRWREFAAESLALALGLRVAVPGVSTNDVVAEVTTRLGRRWQSTGRLEDGVRRVLDEWHRIALVLGWIEARRGRYLDRLSPRGVAAAAGGFWSVAAAPRYE